MSEQKLRLYLAGRMRGIEKLNFPEFERVAGLLRKAGHEVISPAELDLAEGFDPSKGEEDFDLKGAILRDLDAVANVEAVVLLPGWEDSKGARTERALAEFLELKVFEWMEQDGQANLVPLPPPKTILEEAKKLVYGARALSYGHPKADLQRTAALWRALFGWEATAQDVAMAMICVKLSRMRKTPRHLDSLTDLAGYSAVIERLWEE